MTRLVVATSNAGKLRELAALFQAGGAQPKLFGLAGDVPPEGFELVTFAGYVSPVEGDTSYADNAALKARALHAQLSGAGQAEAVLADDSGLEVLALAGRPGVMTAEYGGPGAAWPERRRLLLRELAATGGSDRRARFVCALHYIGPDGRTFATLATVDGEIAISERGVLGFSFDPIFVYRPLARTFAEMTDAQKNQVSHRGLAAIALITMLRAALQTTPRERRGTFAGKEE